MRKLDHAFVRELGFRNVKHFHSEVSKVDLSTKARAKRFRRWKRKDGTFEGIRRLGEIRYHENWPTLLAEFIEKRRHMAFEWGTHDCCLFVCDAVLAITGIDPAQDVFRGKYRDALGARRLLRRHGGVEKIAAKICARLEFGEVRLTLAGRGDVMLYMDGEEPVLGVCLGRLSAFVAPDGLRFVPTLSCSRAWKVGGNV
jgi:hypothetical protein